MTFYVTYQTSVKLVSKQIAGSTTNSENTDSLTPLYISYSTYSKFYLNEMQDIPHAYCMLVFPGFVLRINVQLLGQRPLQENMDHEQNNSASCKSKSHPNCIVSTVGPTLRILTQYNFSRTNVLTCILKV